MSCCCAPVRRTLPSSEPPAPVGSTIEIHSLKNVPQLNGKRAKVVGHKKLEDGTTCMVVELEDGKKQLIKPANAKVVQAASASPSPQKPAAEPSPPEASPAATSPSPQKPPSAVPPAPIGTAVEIHGLQNMPELNGKKGKVVGHKELGDGSMAMAVDIGDKKTLVKPANAKTLAPGSESPAASSEPPAPVGSTIEIHSLKNVPQLNGKRAKVVGHKKLEDGTTCMVVELEDGKKQLIKPANAKVVQAASASPSPQKPAAEPSPPEASPAATSPSPQKPPSAVPPAPIGTAVEIHGLQNMPELNGKKGKVVGHKELGDGSMAMAVDIGDKKTLVKPANAKTLAPGSESPAASSEPPAPVGSTIEIHSLKNVPQLNGKHAKVVGHKKLEDGTTCTVVELDDGKKQLIKPANAKVVQAASASPAATSPSPQKPPSSVPPAPIGTAVEIHGLPSW